MFKRALEILRGSDNVLDEKDVLGVLFYRRT
jgi:hypothetical protein